MKSEKEIREMIKVLESFEKLGFKLSYQEKNIDLEYFISSLKWVLEEEDLE
jgi:hypothetical protein